MKKSSATCFLATPPDAALYTKPLPPPIIRAWTNAARIVALACLVSAIVQLQYVGRRPPRPPVLLTLESTLISAFFTLPVLFMIQAVILVKWRSWRTFGLSGVLFAAAWVATCLVFVASLSALR